MTECVCMSECVRVACYCQTIKRVDHAPSGRSTDPSLTTNGFVAVLFDAFKFDFRCAASLRVGSV